MKKLIFLIALMLTVVISSAQMLTTNLGSDATYVKVTTDYTLTNTTARYWQINTEPKYYNAQSLVIHLDSASGNHTNMAVALTGRISDVDPTWTAIGSTVNWKGTTADTTIIITNATENVYRQFKLTFTGTGTGTTTIADMVFKQYYGIP